MTKLTKEKIQEYIKYAQNNDAAKITFEMLDNISKLLKEDKKFFNFASKQAKENFVSPSDMFLLAYDYLADTGKYEEWKKSKEDSKAKNISKDKEIKEPKKEIKSIFDLKF